MKKLWGFHTTTYTFSEIKVIYINNKQITHHSHHMSSINRSVQLLDLSHLFWDIIYIYLSFLTTFQSADKCCESGVHIKPLKDTQTFYFFLFIINNSNMMAMGTSEVEITLVPLNGVFWNVW